MANIVRTWEDEEIELTDAQLEVVYGASDDSYDDAIPADMDDDDGSDTSDPAVEGTSSVPTPGTSHGCCSHGCCHDLLCVKKKKRKLFFLIKDEEIKKVHVS